ncbi:sigma-70 family RNA polymerase sigma factor [Candidatus Margulisiibacteriota bacterium]
MLASKKEVEDQIIASMKNHFMQFSDEVLQKYHDQINQTVNWYMKGLPRNVAKREADDLASEAKIAFINALKTWDPRKGELWPYVSIRLKGSMQDYLRKRGSDPVTGIYEFITSAANVYMAFNREELAKEHSDSEIIVETAMKTLSETERAVINGYYKHDKTFKHIGKDVGLSESQVSRIAKTATAKMRKTFKK